MKHRMVSKKHKEFELMAGVAYLRDRVEKRGVV